MGKRHRSGNFLTGIDRQVDFEVAAPTETVPEPSRLLRETWTAPASEAEEEG